MDLKKMYGLNAFELKITIGRICDRVESQCTKVFEYSNKVNYTADLFDTDL